MTRPESLRVLIGSDELAAVIVAAVDRTDPTVTVERLDVAPVHRGFPTFVNDGTIDISEIAVVTLLQAIESGRPVGLLPVTVLGRFQHHTLVTCKGIPVDALPGSTIGIRSWTQTTGVWVRGALAEQHGLDLHGVDWVTYEDGHVAGYRDPDWVRRAGAGSRLVADLAEGRLDAAIIGNDLPAGTSARPVLDDPQAEARQWSKAAGCVPVNHVVGVNLATARERPELVRAIYTALRGATAEKPLSPTGFDGLRGALTRAADYALAQQILTRPVGFEEITGPTADILGSADL
jgi:4,5-dihydroxyphthalate decarboxylase